MREIDVDFNTRTDENYVSAWLPKSESSIVSGDRVYLRDPFEDLWAEAVVVRVDAEHSIADFAVDWDSFTEGRPSVKPPSKSTEESVSHTPDYRKLRSRGFRKSWTGARPAPRPSVAKAVRRALFGHDDQLLSSIMSSLVNAVSNLMRLIFDRAPK